MRNLSAIIWLYRGQRGRYLALVQNYLRGVCVESAAVPERLAVFESTLGDLRERFARLAAVVESDGRIEVEKREPLTAAVAELAGATDTYETDRVSLVQALEGLRGPCVDALPETNEQQHAARREFEPIAEAIRGLVRQIDLLCKLAARAADLSGELAGNNGPVSAYDRRAAVRILKQLDEQRKAAVEQLKQPVYFHRQVTWLQDRFPDAELRDAPGLVKLVERSEIEAADWSLTPGRYVGVAPAEEDEDFDFEQTLRDIHVELADLNAQAVGLAAKIQADFEALGI